MLSATRVTELPLLSNANAPPVQTLPITFFAIKIDPTSKKTEEAMRGVVFTGERGLELMPFPDPSPDAHDVVIEMKASGMCGSDLHQYRRPKGQARATGIPATDGPSLPGTNPAASWSRSAPRSMPGRRASASA
jgi:hypothetical protein